MHDTGFVQDLAMVLGVAALTGLLFQLVRQPSVLGYLLAGLIVGPYIPVPLFADPERVHKLSEFGVVLVMFGVGLEFRIEKFLKVLPVSGVTAAIEIGALFGVGYYVGLFLGWNSTQALFLGACVCISSTMAVSKILDQQPLPDDSRQFVFGVLVLQDVAAIALIALMTAIGQGSKASLFGVALILGKLVAVLLALIAGGMFIVPRLVRLLVKTGSPETLVVGAVGLCFSFALFAEQLGYSVALGAFIAGVLVAESGHGLKVEHATSAVRDVFAAVFFVSIGMTVDPRVAVTYFPTALVVLVAVVLTQFVSVTVGGVLSGSGVRRSVAAGVSLGQIGEFAFIISAIGVSSRVVTPELQPVLVTVAVISTFTTSLGLRFRDTITHWVDRATPSRLRRLLAIYEAWFDAIRASAPRPGRGVRRSLRGIAFDLGLMTAIVFAWKAWREAIEAYLAGSLDLGESINHTVSTLALVVALLPVLVPLSLSARKLAMRLADRVFDSETSSGYATLQAALFLLVVAALAVPIALLLGAVVGVKYVWPALVLALVAAATVAWRKARILDDDIQSGGLLMLRAIAKQGAPEAASNSHETAHPVAEPVDGFQVDLGLGHLHPFTLGERAYAVGKTLAQLRLRSATGASVVALRSKGSAMQHASGQETLYPEDTLFIAGCRADQEAAEKFLTDGPSIALPAERQA